MVRILACLSVAWPAVSPWATTVACSSATRRVAPTNANTMYRCVKNRAPRAPGQLLYLGSPGLEGPVRARGAVRQRPTAVAVATAEVLARPCCGLLGLCLLLFGALGERVEPGDVLECCVDCGPRHF